MELSITEIDQLISTLLPKWFPIVGTSVRHGGYVFGGVLREMWAAIRSFQPQKGVLIETHVMRHMEFYFQHGGDIDISIGEEEFCEAFAKNPMGYNARHGPVFVGEAIEVDQIFAEHNKITDIKLAEDPYEITKIVKRCVRDKMVYEGGHKSSHYETSSDDDGYYSYSAVEDRYIRSLTQKIKSEFFPTRHYMMKVKSIFGIVNVDVIIVMKTGADDDASKEKLKTLCDFTCNLLILKEKLKFLKYGPSEKLSDMTFAVVTSRDENVDLETIDQDILNRHIRVLGDHTNHMKVLYRLVKRLETTDMYGNRCWTLSNDVKNKKSLSVLLYKTLKVLPYDLYDVGTTTVSHREERVFYRVFLQSYPVAVFALYEFCKTEMFEHIRFSINKYQKNHGGLIRAGDIGQDRSVLEYLQNLCISNDGYEDFRRRSRKLDPWSQNTSDEDIWRHTIQHAPQMIPKMYKLVPLKTPQLAFVFVQNLMKFSRVSELATFLSMKSGPKFVKLFNDLDDGFKCEKIIRLFLVHLYHDTACDISMLELFVKHGAKLPKRLVDDYGKERVSFQYEKTDTLKFFMKHHIVKIEHLFPDLFSAEDRRCDGRYDGRYHGCIRSTVENLRWVIEELGPSSGKTKEMVGILADNLAYADRKEFLPIYKHWCAEAGVTPNEYARFITEILKRDSWSELAEHFEYLFGTDFPSLDQIATVGTITRGYSDRKEKLFVLKFDRDIIKISKRLVMRYGPQFFLAELTSGRRHYGMNSSRSWFVLAYWLWQICHNSETPCRAAWQLPIPIIDKIESYISTGLSYGEKERDDANRKEEFMRYAKLRASYPCRFGDGMHFYE